MRTKGLDARELELDPMLIESGAVHQVDIQRGKQAYETSPDMVDPNSILSAVLGRQVVISSEFAKEMDRVVQHEVFPDKIIAENRSAHGVGFGRFVGRRQNRPSNGEVVQVAMKPFGEPEAAVREVLGYWTLSSIGIETYSPIGIFPSENSSATIVVTKKRNDLISLDRDDWVEGRQVRNEIDAEVAQRNNSTVAEIAQTLAWLNVNGVFHEDGQLKNFAVTNTGSIGVIDTEKLTQRELGDQDSVGLAVRDIEKLLKSLMSNDRGGKIFGVGMLAGFSNEDLRASYEELILTPYIDALMNLYMDGQLEDRHLQQAEMLMDGLQAHFNANAQLNWPACLV